MSFGALASDPDQRQLHIKVEPRRELSAGQPRNFFVKVATTFAVGVDASKSAVQNGDMEKGKLLNHALDSADCRYSRRHLLETDELSDAISLQSSYRGSRQAISSA